MSLSASFIDDFDANHARHTAVIFLSVVSLLNSRKTLREKAQGEALSIHLPRFPPSTQYSDPAVNDSKEIATIVNVSRSFRSDVALSSETRPYLSALKHQ